MNKLLNFDQVIKKANKPHLLLGNGFSMAYDAERFSFTSLLQSAVDSKIINKKDSVYKVFEKLQTADFESVMRMLDNAQKIVEVYGGEEKIIELIKNDINNLKEHLVEIITNNHPEKSTDVAELNKKACIKFLSNFDKIYTLNYDLLLYWATMSDESSYYTDGFSENDDSIHEGYVVYTNKYSMKVHYLHGGLHIFDAGSEIIKKTYSKTGINLMEQISENLKRRIYPIFISEGDSKQKLTKILHNAYLNHCYKSFRGIGGDLVILGTLLKKNDDHILDALLENDVENIYLGVSKLSDAGRIQLAIDEYNKGLLGKKTKKKSKKLYAYDYKTINIWGLKNN